MPTMTMNPVVSREVWLEARKAHLAREKALTRARDAILRERRQLPWVRLDKNYQFATASGVKSLAALFADKNQLLIYHFMFGPDWEQGCPSCSLAAETMNANLPHLAQRDVAFTAVSRAPIAKILAFQQRMEWSFPGRRPTAAISTRTSLSLLHPRRSRGRGPTTTEHPAFRLTRRPA